MFPLASTYILPILAGGAELWKSQSIHFLTRILSVAERPHRYLEPLAITILLRETFGSGKCQIEGVLGDPLNG
jgi:hypothetical protein